MISESLKTNTTLTELILWSDENEVNEIQEYKKDERKEQKRRKRDRNETTTKLKQEEE